jgi:hypothetical protein
MSDPLRVLAVLALVAANAFLVIDLPAIAPRDSSRASRSRSPS